MSRSICLFFLLAAPAALFGQMTGQLSRTVVDPTGAAIACAMIGSLLPGGRRRW